MDATLSQILTELVRVTSDRDALLFEVERLRRELEKAREAT